MDELPREEPEVLREHAELVAERFGIAARAAPDRGAALVAVDPRLAVAAETEPTLELEVPRHSRRAVGGIAHERRQNRIGGKGAGEDLADGLGVGGCRLAHGDVVHAVILAQPVPGCRRQSRRWRRNTRFLLPWDGSRSRAARSRRSSPRPRSSATA